MRTAFTLPENERSTIQNALNETFSADVHVRFETAPSLVCGIELVTSGLKVGWSIDGYLQSMEAAVTSVLQEQAETLNREIAEIKTRIRAAKTGNDQPAEKTEA